jgi:hypothetical protein
MEVISRIEGAQKEANADVVVIEIGGTIGEYQNMLFLEAARMMKIKNPKSVFFVMVSYLPVPGTIGEMKTKPTQMAVRAMNASGIQPDIIIARGKQGLDDANAQMLVHVDCAKRGRDPNGCCGSQRGYLNARRGSYVAAIHSENQQRKADKSLHVLHSSWVTGVSRFG